MLLVARDGSTAHVEDLEEIVVEALRLALLVGIGGYDFALNGAARSRFGLPFAHDAGVAVLGRSVGPFIEMAHGLSA